MNISHPHKHNFTVWVILWREKQQTQHKYIKFKAHMAKIKRSKMSINEPIAAANETAMF